MSDAVDYWVRPMRDDDVPAVERLTATAFHAVSLRTRRGDGPEPQPRSADGSDRWRLRARHLLGTDPEGCFVAETPAGPVGAVIALRRDLTWILSTYAVAPEVQGRGVGRQLLAAALDHGRSCLRGMIASSEDQRALRRYHAAGFELHPMMRLSGVVPRAALPVVERVREGSAADVDLLDSVDRRVRDAAHGPDHELLLGLHRLVVSDGPTGSGYAYVADGGGTTLLAATSRRTATRLLWECLAASSPDEPCDVEGVTAANAWAVDVGMAAGMAVHTEGYLALRGMRPPAPYLPSGHVL